MEKNPQKQAGKYRVEKKKQVRIKEHRRHWPFRLEVNLLRCSCENILQYSALNFCHVSAIRGRPEAKSSQCSKYSPGSMAKAKM